jgi:hypothetical protein
MVHMHAVTSYRVGSVLRTIYIYIVVCVAMPQYPSCEASTMELLCRQDEKAYFILVIQSAMSVFCTIYVAHKSLSTVDFS